MNEIEASRATVDHIRMVQKLLLSAQIEINRDRFGMSDQLVDIFKNTVPWVQDEFEGLNTQKDLGANGHQRTNQSQS